MKKLFLVLAFYLVLCSLGWSKGQTTPSVPARPIWIWGLPASIGAEFDQASLKAGNEWAMKNFGSEFRLTPVPQGVDAVQGLQLLIAENKFPDVMLVGNLSNQNLMIQFAEEGRLLALDKYFTDARLPHLARVGKNTLFISAYKYDGKIYALPGWNTRLEADEPAWPGNLWWSYNMQAKTAFGVPKNMDELLAVLKKIRDSNFTDQTTGGKLIPFGMQGNAGDWTAIIQAFAGAGWEYATNGKLIPHWASEETKNSIKYMNTLFRENLLHPQFDNYPFNKWLEECFRVGYGVVVGPTYVGNGCGASNMYNASTKGEDPKSAQMNEWRKKLYTSIVPPIKSADGKIGKYVNALAATTLVSKDIPNPDAFMKLADWLLSDEGKVTWTNNAGLKGVDWDWTTPPAGNNRAYWKLLYDNGNKANPWAPSPEREAGAWRNAEDSKKNPPRILPWIGYVTQRTYAATDYRVSFDYSTYPYSKIGIFVDYAKEGDTIMVQDDGYAAAIQKGAISPNPSYDVVNYKMEPQEAGAFGTALQRWNEGLPKLFRAASDAEFEAEYKAFIQRLVDVTGSWKSIYEKRQKAWEGWMTSNKADDRGILKQVTPTAEWKKVMGW